MLLYELLDRHDARWSAAGFGRRRMPRCVRRIQEEEPPKPIDAADPHPGDGLAIDRGAREGPSRRGWRGWYAASWTGS